MVSASEIRKLAEQLAKAEGLVESGAVFPVSGLPGYSVVRNGDGNSMYLVRFETGREHCTCPDFQHRQGKAGQPCKPILAAGLHQEAGYSALAFEEGDDQETKEVSSEDEIVTKIQRLRGRLSIAWLNGDDDEADRLSAEIQRLASQLPPIEFVELED